MNSTSQRISSLIGVLGAFLIVGILVLAMTRYLQPAPLNTARINERKKALADIRAENDKAIHSYEVLDVGKGLIRLRLERAMELTVQEYQNPAAARTTMIARANKAAEPPPKPPEAPNKYE
jgi:hypothetical protein